MSRSFVPAQNFVLRAQITAFRCNEDVPSGPTSATDKRQDNSDKDDEEDSYEDVIRACWC